MRMTGKALIGVLVLCASGLAAADSLEWVAGDTRPTLVPGGVTGTLALNVCRATVGSVVAVGEYGSDRTGECRVVVGGRLQSALQFELLAQVSKAEVGFTWVPGHAMGYPQWSVVGGRAADGSRTLVCAAVHLADGSVHPGYIADENCVYSANGSARVADNYLVLVSDDPAVAATEEAQPAMEGFDPNAILGVAGVTSLCAMAQGLCTTPAAR